MTDREPTAVLTATPAATAAKKVMSWISSTGYPRPDNYRSRGLGRVSRAYLNLPRRITMFPWRLSHITTCGMCAVLDLQMGAFFLSIAYIAQGLRRAPSCLWWAAARCS